MNPFGSVDKYDLHARIYPALLTLSPILMVGLAWLPAMPSVQIVLLCLAGATSCGLVYLMAEISRSFGMRIEARLLAKWGGKPSIVMLRHRDKQISSTTKERYRRYLSEQAISRPWPTFEEEQANPELADEIYSSSVQWLREQCRDQTFALVEKENANYGFRRNMLGLKGLGILAALMAAAAGVVRILEVDPFVTRPLDKLELESLVGVCLALTFAIMGLMFWIFIVGGNWVRLAAENYARALLACCDRLGRKSDEVSRLRELSR